MNRPRRRITTELVEFSLVETILLLSDGDLPVEGVVALVETSAFRVRDLAI